MLGLCMFVNVHLAVKQDFISLSIFMKSTPGYIFLSLHLQFICTVGQTREQTLISYLMRQTTPPEPPESKATKLRIKSPVLTSHSLTVPSSELVTTKRELNCRQVTAD